MTAVLVLVLAGAAVWFERRRRRRNRWRRVLHNHSRVRVTARDRLGSVGRVRPTLGVAVPAMVAVAATAGALAGGPVAAVVAGLYGGVAAWAVVRGLNRREESVSRQGAVDAVAALAAELRAGLPLDVARATAKGLQAPAVVGADARAVAGRVDAAVQVAESCGAPVADVLERLDTHLRAVERAHASASAQAAGARVSAVLLAAMPVAGVGLGGLIGADPAPVLLRTRLGAACLLGAVVLQVGGLAWATRLSRVEVPA